MAHLSCSTPPVTAQLAQASRRRLGRETCVDRASGHDSYITPQVGEFHPGSDVGIGRRAVVLAVKVPTPHSISSR